MRGAGIQASSSKIRIRPIAVVHGHIRYDCNVQKAEVQGGCQKAAQQRYCLLHHAHIMQITGESYRLKDKRKASEAQKRAPATA